MDIRPFLSRHGLLADDIDSDALIREFILEMEAGLTGRESSLAMIPAYVSAERELPVDEPVIVMDAGGTNFRVACISFDHDHHPRIEEYATYPMPGSQTEVSASEFFNLLAQYLRPALNKSTKIGFGFSYPAEISSDMDGRLLRWTKEMKAPDVIGRLIGRGLLDTLGSTGTGKSIVFLNDTVATLLAGKAAGKKSCCTYVGFILGTGTNIAYLEKNKNILKAGHLYPSGSQAINVESGGFSKAPRGDIDMILDQESEDPGGNRFEKMISGKYLPEIALMILKKGVNEGLFDASLASWIGSQEQLSHDHMDDLISNGGTGLLRTADLSDPDRERIREIMRAVIERAAKLAAVNLTAVVAKAVSECRDLSVCIDIDGTTYYKAAGLREDTEKYLRDMLGARSIPYTLVHVERAPIIGAAIAALLN